MRLLILTHTFPPSTHSNAKRPYYVTKGFLNAGWQVDVITSPLAMPPVAAETIIHPALRIIRSEDPVEAFRLRFRKHPKLSRAISLLLAGLLWPDPWVVWVRRSLKVAREQPEYDRVLVFLQPASLLLTGRPDNLCGPRWTFDLQEALTPHFRRHGRSSPLQKALLRRLERLEAHTLHKAGRVIFTAESNRRTYIQAGLAAEQSTIHIPYFYDDAEFCATDETPSGQFDIVYLGTFDWRGQRSPETFLRALALFLDRCPAARGKTRFVFHGIWQPKHDALIDELRLADVVTRGQPLPYEEYLRRLKQSPVLLLVVAAAHNLFMPSKIVDYFGARRPILAFAPRDSEMRAVLEAAGMADHTCDPSDFEAGARSLEQLWTRFQSGQLKCDGSKTAFWSSQTQMPRYLRAVISAGEPQ